LLGKKTLENEILWEALALVPESSPLSAYLKLRGAYIGGGPSVQSCPERYQAIMLPPL